MKGKEKYTGGKWIPCRRCHATGKVACTQCSGTSKHVSGVFCTLCKATGRIECNACDGKGGYEYIHDFSQTIKN